MECRFCLKEIDSGVRICKYCKEFIGEGDDPRTDLKFVKCPYCQSDIIEGAKVCKECHEEIESHDNFRGNGAGRSDGNTGGRGDDILELFYQGMLRIKRNFLIIAFVGFLVYVCWPSGDDDNDVVGRNETNYVVQYNGKKYRDSVEMGLITFNPTTKGYIAKGELLGYPISCNLKSSDMDKFVKGIDEKGYSYATGCTFVNNKKSNSFESDSFNDDIDFDDFGDDFGDDFDSLDFEDSFTNQKNVGIFFDNSYAKGGDKTDGPDQRMGLMRKYFSDKYFGNGTKISFVVPYGDKNDKEGATVEDELYTFTIDSDEFTRISNLKIRYLAEKGEEPYIKFVKNKKNLYIKNIEFSFGTDYSALCVEDDGMIDNEEEIDDLSVNKTMLNNQKTYNYLCMDAKNVYNKILEIYKGNFRNNKNKTRGNLILAAKAYYFDDKWDDLYIFSDGEFEISGGWSLEKYFEKLMSKLKINKDNLPEHPITNFHADNYKYYQSIGNTFEDFWDDAIQYLKHEKIKNKCIDTNIYLVGATNRFGSYIDKMYTEIFDGCNFERIR